MHEASQGKSGAKKKRSTTKSFPMVDKVKSGPGVPGPTQKIQSFGEYKRVKIHAVSEGI